jgi:hypothetical protein
VEPDRLAGEALRPGGIALRPRSMFAQRALGRRLVRLGAWSGAR